MSTQKTTLTKGLRENLKAIVQNEIEKLPEQLETLEPKDRVQVLFKLMPYVFPKVDTVHFKEGEPWSID
jgi:DNA-binding transcriptional regulator/RsmH inhibitor MraZ